MKYRVSFFVSAIWAPDIGDIEAESFEEAAQKALLKAMEEEGVPSLCWQCSSSFSMDDLPNRANVECLENEEFEEVSI